MFVINPVIPALVIENWTLWNMLQPSSKVDSNKIKIYIFIQNAIKSKPRQ